MARGQHRALPTPDKIKKRRRNTRLAQVIACAAALTAGGVTALVLTAEFAESAPAPVEATSDRSGAFIAGSGNYLTTEDGTDGLRDTVTGVVTVRDAQLGAVADVNVTGLAPATSYVAVAYKDAGCVPTPGLTAFPGTSFTTDGSGSAKVTTNINPKAILPTGTFSAAETKSISIRQVVVSSASVLGTVTTPTVPNVGAVEACDRSVS